MEFLFSFSSNSDTEKVYKRRSTKEEEWSANDVLPEQEFRMNSSWVAKVQEQLYEDTQECQVMFISTSIFHQILYCTRTQLTQFRNWKFRWCAKTFTATRWWDLMTLSPTAQNVPTCETTSVSAGDALEVCLFVCLFVCSWLVGCLFVCFLFVSIASCFQKAISQFYCIRLKICLT